MSGSLRARTKQLENENTRITKKLDDANKQISIYQQVVNTLKQNLKENEFKCKTLISELDPQALKLKLNPNPSIIYEALRKRNGAVFDENMVHRSVEQNSAEFSTSCSTDTLNFVYEICF